MFIDVRTLDGYNIATALRGPDSANSLSDTLKALFTARLRYLVKVECGKGNQVRETAHNPPPFASISLWAWPGQRSDWLDGTMHFLGHLIVAFEAIAGGRLTGFTLPQRGEAAWLAEVAECFFSVAHAARYWDEVDGEAELVRATTEAEAKYLEFIRLFVLREVKQC